MLPAFCGDGTLRLLLAPGGTGVLDLTLALNPPGLLLAQWGSMLLAMMPPLLAAPLMHVWRSSLPRRRLRAAAVFALGYASLWMAAGPVLIAFAMLLPVIVGEAAFIVVLLLAVAWSAGPWQRAALNRGHRLMRIGLFGWAADCDCLLFGAVHGGCCVASCWAWMLVPLTAGRWQVAVSMLVAAAMLVERLTPTGRPRWHVPTALGLLLTGSAFVLRQGVLRHG